MAVIKDKNLFEMLGQRARIVPFKVWDKSRSSRHADRDIVQEDFGRRNEKLCRGRIRKLYETHQCRPHAYGHTWSPGFELQAGLLHGHAVSIGMGFGAYLSKRRWLVGRAFVATHSLFNL